MGGQSLRICAKCFGSARIRIFVVTGRFHVTEVSREDSTVCLQDVVRAAIETRNEPRQNVVNGAVFQCITNGFLDFLKLHDSRTMYEPGLSVNPTLKQPYTPTLKGAIV